MRGGGTWAISPREIRGRVDFAGRVRGIPKQKFHAGLVSALSKAENEAISKGNATVLIAVVKTPRPHEALYGGGEA